MATYTLFAANPKGSRMDQYAKYEAADDSSAMDLAGRLSRNRSTELWSEHRHVGKFGQPPAIEADPEAGPAA